jgi:hypothetical protein
MSNGPIVTRLMARFFKSERMVCGISLGGTPRTCSLHRAHGEPWTLRGNGVQVPASGEPLNGAK